MGVSALVSPSFPYPVHQLPSPNKYTLSLKVGSLCFLCLYLPPFHVLILCPFFPPSPFTPTPSCVVTSMQDWVALLVIQ
ncbi:hypothetical protein BDF14DRAFT_1846908 [Spinellus fusiger]|nr:hypothetical protein BDF14DRAFT_1846908 [Spinellus fusiger]